MEPIACSWLSCWVFQGHPLACNLGPWHCTSDGTTLVPSPGLLALGHVSPLCHLTKAHSCPPGWGLHLGSGNTSGCGTTPGSGCWHLGGLCDPRDHTQSSSMVLGLQTNSGRPHPNPCVRVGGEGEGPGTPSQRFLTGGLNLIPSSPPCAVVLMGKWGGGEFLRHSQTAVWSGVP